jgi:hypothetical protein
MRKPREFYASQSHNVKVTTITIEMRDAMVASTLIALARFNLQFGLIGIDEHIERCEVALWLDDRNGKRLDPRAAAASEEHHEEKERGSADNAGDPPQKRGGDGPHESDSGEVEFLFRGWIFTKSDPDPYPSTPHGHWRNPNAKWPKLNPYTGRVFKEKHQEDISARLSKKEMKELWNDSRFRDFCRSYILWYREAFPHHAFSVADPLRFPRWW